MLRRLLRPHLDPERLRGGQQSPGGVEQRAGAVALAPVHREPPRQDRVTLADDHRARRVAPSAAPAPSAGRLRSWRPARWWGSRAPPRRTPCRTWPLPSSSELVRRPVGREHAVAQRAREHAAARRPARGRGRRRSRWGRGGGRHQWSRPAADAAAASSGGDGVGHLHQQLGGRALRDERVAVAQLDALAVAHHAQRPCRSAAAGAARPSPPRRRPGPPRPRRCSRRWPTPGVR